MKGADWNITELEDLKKAAGGVLYMCAAARGPLTDAVHSLDILFRHLPHKISQRVLRQSPRPAHGATTLALHGELGAGKTAFVQELGRLLGVKETITSPTFVVMKCYKTAHDSFKNLVHIDAYRLDSVDEMRVLGFKPLLEEKDTIICIEWAERIAELIPEDALHLHFELTGPERTLRLISN